LLEIGKIISAKTEFVDRFAEVSTVGLEPKTSPTNGNPKPVSVEVN
jgi:hypothetical protein